MLKYTNQKADTVMRSIDIHRHLHIKSMADKYVYRNSNIYEKNLFFSI